MQVYRLNISTIGIQSVDGKSNPVVIPAGAMLGRLREETTLAICVWDGGEVQVLSLDLQERGVLMSRVGY